MLVTVKASGVVELEAAVKPEQSKKEAVEEEMKTWREKKMHGQFLRQLDELGVDIKGTWNWLKKADLKSHAAMKLSSVRCEVSCGQECGISIV